MPSPVELAAALLLTVQVAPPDGPGPRATSSESERYDAIGYAAIGDIVRGVGHASLPIGSHVEVTAIDTGRTVLFAVTGKAPARSDEPVALSNDAMSQLGIAAGAPIRVRSATAMPTDIAALNGGHPAGTRLDAPDALLTGLRKHLPPRPTTPAPAVAKPSAPPAAAKAAAVKPAAKTATPALARPAPKPAITTGWGVQVAALSDAARANALATRVGGVVRPAGRLFRVQLGPFADRAAADAARLRLARQGQGQATLVKIP